MNIELIAASTSVSQEIVSNIESYIVQIMEHSQVSIILTTWLSYICLLRSIDILNLDWYEYDLRSLKPYCVSFNLVLGMKFAGFTIHFWDY